MFYTVCLSAALAAFLPRVNGGQQRKDLMLSAFPAGGFLCFIPSAFLLHLPFFLYGLTDERFFTTRLNTLDIKTVGLRKIFWLDFLFYACLFVTLCG